MSLAHLSASKNAASALTVERTSLKDQTTNLLRDLIVTGQFAPGSKITERDIAELLKISRMPARDALMALESQGLVVNKPGGRFVIELGEAEIRQLYQLRLALEKLAVELAIQNHSTADEAVIAARLDAMRQAIASGDSARYSASDLEMHESIWQQSGNSYLVNMLHSMIGPIFMFIATQARLAEDWQESLCLHEQLAATIAKQDLAAAQESIEAHLHHSLELALSGFRIGPTEETKEVQPA